MNIKSFTYKIKGMQKDLSYSAFNPDYSWENKNIRLTAINSNDLIGITNEKGNLQLLLNETTPLPIDVYSWVSVFNDYVYENQNATDIWVSVFNDYVYES